MGKAVEALKKLKLFDIDLPLNLFLSIRKILSYISVWEKILTFDFWENFFAARDIPQILLLLAYFEFKKSLIKNCWIFLKKFIENSKIFLTYLRNILEDIIH